MWRLWRGRGGFPCLGNDVRVGGDGGLRGCGRGAREVKMNVGGGLAGRLFRNVGSSRTNDVPCAVIGILADTHVRPDKASCELLEKAYRLFRQCKVDAIFHLGDLAHYWSPEAYANYCSIRREVYPDGAPIEKYVHAFHDVVRYPKKATYEEQFEDFRQALGFSHELYDRFELAGFTFLVAPEHPKTNRLESMLSETCAMNSGKPIFLLTHRPPARTTTFSDRFNAADSGTRELLGRYPRTFVFSGHTHGDFRDEGMVWRKDFTAVSIASLSDRNQNVATLELYPDRLEIVRWNLADGLPFDDRIVLPWGFDPKCVERREAERQAWDRAHPPVFPPSAQLAVEPSEGGSCRFRFPQVVNGVDRTRRYILALSREGEAVPYAEYTVPGPWNCPAAERIGEVDVTLPAAWFDAGKRTRVSVFPVSLMGHAGSALENAFCPSRGRWAVCWSGDVPAQKIEDYPYGFKFHLPEGAFQGPVGTRFAISFACESDAYAKITFPFENRKGAGADTLTIPDTEGRSLRYATEFVKAKDGDRVAIWVAHTLAKRISVSGIQVSRKED